MSPPREEEQGQRHLEVGTPSQTKRQVHLYQGSRHSALGVFREPSQGKVVRLLPEWPLRGLSDSSSLHTFLITLLPAQFIVLSLLPTQVHQAVLFDDLRTGNRANPGITRKLLPREHHLGSALSTLGKLQFPFSLSLPLTEAKSLASSWPTPAREPRRELRDWVHNQSYRCDHHHG